MEAATLISVAGHMLFERSGIPESVFMILLGLLAGPVLNIIRAEGLMPLVPFIFTLSILIVLLEGGYPWG